MAPRPLIPVIAGPTGVGKTAVAAAWAEREPITVISADARQVYRGLDVGTAKPDPALLARVAHVGIDLVEPGTRYSAGRFAQDAAVWLPGVRTEGRQPLGAASRAADPFPDAGELENRPSAQSGIAAEPSCRRRRDNRIERMTLLLRFLDAGMTNPSTRCGGRRPKSAKARSRGRLGSGGAAGAMGI